MSTSRLRRNEILSATNRAKENSGYAILRVYPKGVNHKQTSMRVQGLAVMLYILGLSYGAAELVLGSLSVGI